MGRRKKMPKEKRFYRELDGQGTVHAVPWCSGGSIAAPLSCVGRSPQPRGHAWAEEKKCQKRRGSTGSWTGKGTVQHTYDVNGPLEPGS